MPAKFPYQVKKVDLSTADLEFKPGVGKGYVIHELGIIGGAANLVVEIKINDKVMTGLPCDDGRDEFFPVPKKSVNQHPFFETIRKTYEDVPLYRVAPGDEFVLTSGGQAGTCYCIYSYFEGEDLPTNTEPGGVNADYKLVFLHGKGTKNIAAGATEEFELDTPLNPKGIPAFPFKERVPYGKVVEVLGFSTCLGEGSGPNISYDGIQIQYKEEELIAPGWEYVDPALFPYNNPGVNKFMFLWDEKRVYTGGEQLIYRVKCSNSGAAAEDAVVKLTLVALLRSE